MKLNIALSAIAAAVAVFSQAAIAQNTMPASRADVKAEAKTGALAEPGQGPGAMAGSAATNGKSTKSRMDRKRDTKAAAKAGELTQPGEGPGAMAGSGATTGQSTKSRMDRKTETKAQAKAGALVPAGEAANPVAAPQKK